MQVSELTLPRSEEFLSLGIHTLCRMMNVIELVGAKKKREDAMNEYFWLVRVWHNELKSQSAFCFSPAYLENPTNDDGAITFLDISLQGLSEKRAAILTFVHERWGEEVTPEIQALYDALLFAYDDKMSDVRHFAKNILADSPAL